MEKIEVDVTARTLTLHEVPRASEKIIPKLEQALTTTVNTLPTQLQGDCLWINVLKNLRIK